jgi:hypothetical protein
MSAVESAARLGAVDEKSSAGVGPAARHLLNLLAAAGQLPGWLHVASFIADPSQYIDYTKVVQSGQNCEERHMPPATPKGPIDELMSRGETLLRRLLQRLQWLWDCQNAAGRPFVADTYLRVLSCDRSWIDDGNAFIKEAEMRVTDMLSSNPAAFAQFRMSDRNANAYARARPLSDCPRAPLVVCAAGR